VSRQIRIAILIGLIALCACVQLKTAWLSDDSYITLRTIDNFWNGYGLRWNVIDRVQTYTHPLWMLLLAAAYGVTREAYFTTITVSLACVAATVGLLLRRLPIMSAALALLWLIASRAFVEFSTSGLENPLSHLLLVLFWLEADRGDDNTSARPNLTRLCVIGALCYLNRMDLALLVAPRLLASIWPRPRGAWRAMLAGGLLVILWHAFAIVYYGTIVPNTALAKLATGLPLWMLVKQGGYYLLQSLMMDPVTPLTIALAGVWAIARPSVTTISLAIGLTLHLLYVVRIGGDFMGGRFLSAPFVCAVCVLAPRLGRLIERRPVPLAAIATTVIGVSLIAPDSPLRLWAPLPVYGQYIYTFHYIVNERFFYAPYTGLPAVLFKGQSPGTSQLARYGLDRHGLPSVVEQGSVGIPGYYGGPALHIVDAYALTEPLLARQPMAVISDGFRIGHFLRGVPAGYDDSLAACQRHLFPFGAVVPTTHSCLEWPDTNRLVDPDLARQYDCIRTVTQGPLFTVARLRAIVSLNVGKCH
jgi:arabinofuranosyltransferase